MSTAVDLEPGMVITAIDTITSDIKVLELQPLVVSGTDYEADTVSGTRATQHHCQRQGVLE